MSNKPLIFISHITEEKELAKLLADFIKKSYLNMFDVFVSSDGESIASGDRWIETIDKALNSCVIQVSLCSPFSIQRPWINFEAGASWIRRIPVIPICHSGLSKSNLPVPLSLLQGIDIEQHDGLSRFCKTLSDKLGSDIPVIDTSELIKRYKSWSYEYTYLNNIKYCVHSLCEMIPELSKAFIDGIQSIPLNIPDQYFGEVGKLLDFLRNEDLIIYNINRVRIGNGIFKNGNLTITDKYLEIKDSI